MEFIWRFENDCTQGFNGRDFDGRRPNRGGGGASHAGDYVRLADDSTTGSPTVGVYTGPGGYYGTNTPAVTTDSKIGTYKPKFEWQGSGTPYNYYASFSFGWGPTNKAERIAQREASSASSNVKIYQNGDLMHEDTAAVPAPGNPDPNVDTNYLSGSANRTSASTLTGGATIQPEFLFGMDFTFTMTGPGQLYCSPNGSIGVSPSSVSVAP